jgi:hypothetical protein
VSTLNVNPGATLNLDKLALYKYLWTEIHRIQAGEGAIFGGGQIIKRSGNISGIIPLLLD